MFEDTAIFGRVEILETFDDEAAARAAGYHYDAHAFAVNDRGAIETVPYKVLARDTDFIHREYCKINKNGGENND